MSHLPADAENAALMEIITCPVLDLRIYLHPMPKLKHVYGDLICDNRDLPELETVSGALTRGTWGGRLPKLRFVGGEYHGCLVYRHPRK